MTKDEKAREAERLEHLAIKYAEAAEEAQQFSRRRRDLLLMAGENRIDAHQLRNEAAE